MRGLWLFIHVIGFTLWLGGGIATMVAGVSAKSFEPGPRLVGRWATLPGTGVQQHETLTFLKNLDADKDEE